MLRWVTTMPLVRDLETDWGNDEGYDRDTVLKSLYWYVIETNRRRKEDFGIWVSRFEISTFTIDVFNWNIIRYFLSHYQHAKKWRRQLKFSWEVDIRTKWKMQYKWTSYLKKIRTIINRKEKETSRTTNISKNTNYWKLWVALIRINRLILWNTK